MTNLKKHTAPSPVMGLAYIMRLAFAGNNLQLMTAYLNERIRCDGYDAAP